MNKTVARSRVFWAATALLLLSCSTPSAKALSPASSRSFPKHQVEDIREAVLRYHIAQVPSKLYFVSVMDASPSTEFLRRFGKEPVKPRSMMSSNRFDVTDKKT